MAFNSKKTNGNNPLGGARLDPSSGVEAAVGLEAAIGLRTPMPSMDCGSKQLPNQTIIIPKKRRSGRGGTPIPWTVSLASTVDEEVTTYTSSIVQGTVVDGILSHTTVTVVNNLVDGSEVPLEVVETDLIVLTYTYATDTPTDEIFSVDIATVDGSYKPYDEDEEDPPNVIAVKYPLAQIISDGGDGLVVEQFARNNLALTMVCLDGKALKYFQPL
jgi:hypothetical protein